MKRVDAAARARAGMMLTHELRQLLELSADRGVFRLTFYRVYKRASSARRAELRAGIIPIIARYKLLHGDVPNKLLELIPKQIKTIDDENGPVH